MSLSINIDPLISIGIINEKPKKIVLYDMTSYFQIRVPIIDTIENMAYIVEHKPRCYHELLEGDRYIKFVIDIDKKQNFIPPFDKILKDLKIFLKNKDIPIKTKDIKYTKNVNKESYHIVIPKLNVLCSNLKYLLLEFSTIHPEYHMFIDYTIYDKSKLLRLPFQLKENTFNTQHIPVNTNSIRDFFVTIIEENSINIDDKITTPEIIQKKKEKKIENMNINMNKYEKTNDYLYIIDEIEIKQMLDDLDESYLNDFKLWLKISSVLKYHNLYNMWDEWSKKSEKYNKINNDIIYEHLHLIIDINYINENCCEINYFNQITDRTSVKMSYPNYY